MDTYQRRRYAASTTRMVSRVTSVGRGALGVGGLVIAFTVLQTAAGRTAVPRGCCRQSLKGHA